MTSFFRNSFTAASLAIVATAFTLGVSAGPAMANPAERQIAITLSAADFANADARAALESRIDRAVRHVCDQGQDRTLAATLQRKQCVAQARQQSQQQVAAFRAAQVQMADARR